MYFVSGITFNKALIIWYGQVAVISGQGIPQKKGALFKGLFCLLMPVRIKKLTYGSNPYVTYM